MSETRGQTTRRRLEDHHLFLEVARTFEDLEIPFWLDQGTLLGLIRERRLLETDHDIDLGMWEEDYRKKHSTLIKKLSRPGRFVEAYKPHQLSISALNEDLEMINIAFYRREGTRAVKRVYYPFSSGAADILEKAALFCAHAAAGTLEKKFSSGRLRKTAALLLQRIPASLWRFVCFGAGRSRYFFKPYFMMAVPERFFLHLETVWSEGLILPVPADPEAYLELKYGSGWRRPEQGWQYWTDDGAIVR